MEVEICCGDIQSVMAAKEGGADRIELCSALSEGGVTPSAALVKAAIATGIPKVNVLIRPRPGDFLYTEQEISIMQKDIETACLEGAYGVVVGALTKTGDIDFHTTEKLIKTAKDINPRISLTFHRAFDLSRNPIESLEAIISLGCDWILTSGMAQSAYKGIENLSLIVREAKNRIGILAGGGVTPKNALDIINKTMVNAIHSSARSPHKSGMLFQRKDLSMGAQGNNEYCWQNTDPKIVDELIKTVSKY